MASTRRKSAAIALAVVGVAGLSLASAAQLNLGTASIGAGSEIIAACDTTGIDLDFTSAWGTGEYDATAVALTNVDAACNGLSYRITVTGAGGVALDDEATGTVSGTSVNATLSGVQAEDVTGVSVVIHS